jgi:putative NADPH-quinone reductase
MARKVVAILGSYRKGGTVDTLVDSVLAGAREYGATTRKVYLIDQCIEYCRNCRTCTQLPGETRGKCVIEDDMPAILEDLESADVVVLASPVNFFNVTAVFRTFLERLLGCVYWPWGQKSPKPRSKKMPRRAVLIASSAAPAFFMPFATGAPRALRLTAQCLGARPVANLWVGMVAQSAKPQPSATLLQRAHKIGEKL